MERATWVETSGSISRTFIIPTPVSGAKRSTWSNLVPINKITIFHPSSCAEFRLEGSSRTHAAEEETGGEGGDWGGG